MNLRPGLSFKNDFPNKWTRNKLANSNKMINNDPLKVLLTIKFWDRFITILHDTENLSFLFGYIVHHDLLDKTFDDKTVSDVMKGYLLIMLGILKNARISKSIDKPWTDTGIILKGFDREMNVAALSGKESLCKIKFNRQEELIRFMTMEKKGMVDFKRALKKDEEMKTLCFNEVLKKSSHLGHFLFKSGKPNFIESFEKFLVSENREFVKSDMIDKDNLITDLKSSHLDHFLFESDKPDFIERFEKFPVSENREFVKSDMLDKDNLVSVLNDIFGDRSKVEMDVENMFENEYETEPVNELETYNQFFKIKEIFQHAGTDLTFYTASKEVVN